MADRVSTSSIASAEGKIAMKRQRPCGDLSKKKVRHNQDGPSSRLGISTLPKVRCDRFLDTSVNTHQSNQCKTNLEELTDLLNALREERGDGSYGISHDEMSSEAVSVSNPCALSGAHSNAGLAEYLQHDSSGSELNCSSCAYAEAAKLIDDDDMSTSSASSQSNCAFSDK